MSLLDALSIKLMSNAESMDDELFLVNHTISRRCPLVRADVDVMFQKVQSNRERMQNPCHELRPRGLIDLFVSPVVLGHRILSFKKQSHPIDRANACAVVPDIVAAWL